MKEPINCPKCKAELTPREILEHSDLSWPGLNWIWFQCPTCEKRTHILIEDGSLSTVAFLGAPGPNWEVIQTIKVKGLSTRMDPGLAHAWLDGIHYEFRSKDSN